MVGTPGPRLTRFLQVLDDPDLAAREQRASGAFRKRVEATPIPAVTTSAGDGDDEGGDATALVVILVAALLLAGIVLLLVRRRYRPALVRRRYRPRRC